MNDITIINKAKKTRRFFEGVSNPNSAPKNVPKIPGIANNIPSFIFIHFFPFYKTDLLKHLLLRPKQMFRQPHVYQHQLHTLKEERQG